MIRERVLRFVAFIAFVVVAVALHPAFAQANAAVTLKWTAPTAHTDGSAISAPLTYNVFAGPKGAAKLKAGTTIAGVLTFTAPNNPLGTCFAITAVESGAGESAQSAEVCMLPVPNAPAGLIIIQVQVIPTPP